MTKLRRIKLVEDTPLYFDNYRRVEYLRAGLRGTLHEVCYGGWGRVHMNRVGPQGTIYIPLRKLRYLNGKPVKAK